MDYFSKKKALYLNVNVFSMNVLIGDTISMSPAGDGTTILRDHQSHVKLFAGGKRQYFHFSVMLRPWVLVWSQELNLRPPALQSSALTNWANPLLWFSNTIHFISERSAMWIWWNGSKKVSYCVWGYFHDTGKTFILEWVHISFVYKILNNIPFLYK